MKIPKRSPFLIASMFLATLFSGCSAFTFQQRAYPYHSSMYSWLGAPISEVETAWGQPSSSFELDGGRTAHVWRKQEEKASCTTVLVADAKGKVVNFNPGDTERGCTKLPPPPSR